MKELFSGEASPDHLLTDYLDGKQLGLGLGV